MGQQHDIRLDNNGIDFHNDLEKEPINTDSFARMKSDRCVMRT